MTFDVDTLPNLTDSSNTDNSKTHINKAIFKTPLVLVKINNGVFSI